MKKITFGIAFVALAIFFSSCDGPLNRKYNEETLNDDLQTIIAQDKVDKKDLENLAFYLIKCNIEGIELEGKTYKELIKEANELAEN